MRKRLPSIVRLLLALALVVGLVAVTAIPASAQVTGVGFTASPPRAGAVAQYVVSFTTSPTGALTANVDTITVQFPAGVDLLATIKKEYVMVAGTTTEVCSVDPAVVQTLNQIILITPVAVAASTAATVTFAQVAGIENPDFAAVANFYVGYVNTSQDTTPVASATYSAITTDVHFTPALGPLGTAITVTGVGFAPSKSMDITDAGLVVIGTGTTTATGTFDLTAYAATTSTGTLTATDGDGNTHTTTATFTVAPAPATIYVPDHYPSIQAAVNAASPGDTIIVRDGTYTENVDVNKDHLNIQSENGAEGTIVQAANSVDHVLEVNADYATISGFTVEGATGIARAGIYLGCDGEYHTISNNICSDNYHGIVVGGTNHNTISENNCSSNFGNGILLGTSDHNTLASNTLDSNGCGILLLGSSSNTIRSNHISNNWHGIYLDSVSIDSSWEFSSNDNVIYQNNFMHNTDSVQSLNFINIWNSPDQITYSYNGNTYTSHLGNHWSDYTGVYSPPVGHSDPGDQWINEPLAYDENRNTYARVYLSGGMDSSPLELLAPSGKPTEGIRFWGSGGPLEVDIYYDGYWHCLRDWPWGISSAPANEWVELTYPSKIVEKARIKFHGRVLSGWSYLNEFQFKTSPVDADNDGIGDTPYSIDSDKDNYPLMEPFESYGLGDSFADLGNAEDEATHNLVGWGDAQGPPENPYVSPSGDTTKRYQTLHGDNSVDLWVEEIGVDYLLTAEVEDGACTDNFEIYVNGQGPIYTYEGKHLDNAAVVHEVAVPAAYVTEPQVTVTFRNTSTDDCGLAAVYNVGLAPAAVDTTPPVADAGDDQSVSSGEFVIFDGSGSYDPDGTIDSYKWDFGDGTVLEGPDLQSVEHRFRGYADGIRIYPVILTVEDDEGATDSHTIHVTVEPLIKTIEIKELVAIAVMTVRYNWVNEANGDDIYVISRIHTYSIGFVGVHDISITSDTHQIWSDVLITTGANEISYSSPFTPTNTTFGVSPPIELITFPEGTFEGIVVRGSDKMELFVFGTTGVGLGGGKATTAFDPEAAVEYPLEPYKTMPVGEAFMLFLKSPGELRVYDSQGRVTGLVNGEITEEIPDSAYFNKTVVILSPSDSYHYEVAGTEDGSYGLVVAWVEDGEATIFTAADIPTSADEVHQYTIDWDALSQGEEGVTLEIDADGDGVFEDTISSDGELTHDEFILQTATVVDFDPDVLYLGSKGKWVTAYVELPTGWDVEDIDLSTVSLNGAIQAESDSKYLFVSDPNTYITDHDEDGILERIVKFDRSEVQEILDIGEEVEITITGEVGEVVFEGSDNIRVIGE